MQTNSAILDSLEEAALKTNAKAGAERERAIATYWAILSDPKRTGPDDAAAMAAAMKTLGKTLQDADTDTGVLEMMHRMPAAKKAWEESVAENSAAKRAVEVHQVAYKEAVEKFKAEGIALRVAALGKENQQRSAGAAMTDHRAFLNRNVETVQQIERYGKGFTPKDEPVSITPREVRNAPVQPGDTVKLVTFCPGKRVEVRPGVVEQQPGGRRLIAATVEAIYTGGTRADLVFEDPDHPDFGKPNCFQLTRQLTNVERDDTAKTMGSWHPLSLAEKEQWAARRQAEEAAQRQAEEQRASQREADKKRLAEKKQAADAAQANATQPATK